PFFAAAALLCTVATGASAAGEPVAVGIASHNHLADSTGLVNKNTVMHNNNVAITKSNVLVRQNDDISLETMDELPADIAETGEKEALIIPHDDDKSEYYGDYGSRYRFMYPYVGGFRYGWRYPISYWNLYGPRIYGGGCGFGRLYGGYYYC
ncbi:hypothetical protein Gpo141_00013853, partial [Globisporangium polare]